MSVLAFAGEYYYPGGGWNDFVGAFGTLEEAVVEVNERRNTPSVGLSSYTYDWRQVVDAAGLTMLVNSWDYRRENPPIE